MEIINIIYHVVNICLFIIFIEYLKNEKIKIDLLTYVIAASCAISVSALEAGQTFFEGQISYVGIRIDQEYTIIIIYAVLLYLLICRDKRWTQNFYCVIQYVSFSLITQLLCAYLICLISQTLNFKVSGRNMAELITDMKSTSMIFKIIIVMFFGHIIKHKKVAEYVGVVHVLMITVCCAFTIYLCQVTDFAGVVGIQDIFLPILNAVLQILLFVVVAEYSSHTSADIDKAILKQQIKSGEELYAKIEENQDELRNVRHDMKNRLMGIYAALNNKDFSKEDIQKEMNRMITDINNATSYKYCNNTAVNTILASKFCNLDNLHIGVKVKLDYPSKLQISYGDLGVILGNLIDNAIEACAYVPDDRRFIHVNGYSHINLWILRIENSCDSESHRKNGNNHGRGINNVSEIIKKYNGVIQSQKDENKYIVEIQIAVY